MTMTYEPFTPAGSPEHGRPAGRRRAAERAEAAGGRAESRAEGYAAPAADPWAAPPRRERRAESRRAAWNEDAWAGSPEVAQGWVEDPRYAGGAPQQQWGAIPQQRHTGEQPRHTGEQPRWEPAPQPRHTGEQPRYTGEQPRHTGEQPRWQDDVARAIPVTHDPAPAGPRPAPSRLKPLLVGALTLLLLLAGWQAYRIEAMSDHNTDLASVLAAEQDRTDRLEKQLAGVFDPETVSSGVLPSVFRVRAGGFTGTAFSVGRKAAGGRSNLFTNYHVVAETWTDGGRRVSLERGKTRITATIVDVDKGKDLALLRAEQEIAGLATATAQVKPGQQVVVVGAPLGLDDSVTTGVISAYRPDDPDGPTIQFDAPINPGNSGGPVVNAEEQVVGLATAKAKDAEGIGLAIPIKTACATFTVC